MNRLGFYIDMTACIGCRTCQIACKDKNNLEAGTLFRRVRSFETGHYPRPGLYHYSESCCHCASPKCVRYCPTAAMHISKDGTVQYDASLCVTCRYCVQYCPYKIPVYIPEKGIIGKCDTCEDLRNKGGNPACVDACLMRCIEFGNMQELIQKYPESTADLPILPSSEETRPCLLITPKEAACNPGYTEQEA